MASPRLVLLLTLALGACQPEIGDGCESSTDCSPSGDRLCDITQPGGYCTIFNCDPDQAICPEEAACVLFGRDRSAIDGCEDPFGVGAYQRTFCLKTCEDDDDCRGGTYACVDIGRENPDAVVLSGPAKVCGIPASGAAVAEPRPSDVCTGTVTPPSDGAAGAGGAAGAAN